METTGISTETTINKENLCQIKRNQYLNCLKSHFHLIRLLSVENEKLLDRMLVLSTKLNILESDNRPTNLPYTKELLRKIEGEILHSLNTIVSKINQNLQQLSNSLISLRQSHEEFTGSSKDIDWDNNSNLMHGSATEKPLFYYVEHSFDIMYCLCVYDKTIKRCIKQSHLNIRDTDLITKVLKCIPISQNLYDLITDVLLNSHFVDKTEKVRNKS